MCQSINVILMSSPYMGDFVVNPRGSYCPSQGSNRFNMTSSVLELLIIFSKIRTTSDIIVNKKPNHDLLTRRNVEMADTEGNCYIPPQKMADSIGDSVNCLVEVKSPTSI